MIIYCYTDLNFCLLLGYGAMSYINKMSILGVRSFGPDQPNIIEFSTPLTLILGQNGCGKTVSRFKHFPARKDCLLSSDIFYIFHITVNCNVQVDLAYKSISRYEAENSSLDLYLSFKSTSQTGLLPLPP